MQRVKIKYNKKSYLCFAHVVDRKITKSSQNITAKISFFFEEITEDNATVAK